MQPRDLAQALLYLASPLSAWVTGHLLVVDDGMHGTEPAAPGSATAAADPTRPAHSGISSTLLHHCSESSTSPPLPICATAQANAGPRPKIAPPRLRTTACQLPPAVVHRPRVLPSATMPFCCQRYPQHLERPVGVAAERPPSATRRPVGFNVAVPSNAESSMLPQPLI